MKILTKEQIERIDGRPDWLLAFDCAVNHGYLRGVASSQLDAMQLLYNEVTGTNYHVNKACPTCVFELVRKLGALYYRSVAAAHSLPEETPAKAASRKARTKKK